MASLYPRKDSPYIWIRYYDKAEPDPRKRRKSVSTKIPNTREGWKAARDLKKRVESGLVEREILHKSGIKLQKRLLLSEGLEEFIASRPHIAEKTIKADRLAAAKMIGACGDKYIHYYSESDYEKLISYLRRKREKLSLSEATISITTMHLSPLWNYFVRKGYAAENIIKIIKPPKKNVEPVPNDELQMILKYFEAHDKSQFQLVYFLLLTGFRISSALIQKWEDINFNDGYMNAINVKARNKPFTFPLYPELRKLLEDIGPKPKGRLFEKYREGDSPKFWTRAMERLTERSQIGKKYKIHDLRKTFTSILVNRGVNQFFVQKLLDHSDIRVTDGSYTKLEIRSLTEVLNDLKIKK